MFVALFSSRNADKYVEKLRSLGIHVEVLPLPTPVWQGDKVSAAWISEIAAKHYQTHAETTDVIQFLIDDWKGRSNNLGHHYGSVFSGYRACVVRNRKGWEDTAEHELLHAANDIIAIYTGVSLARVFGVQDFNEIVHGEAEGYEEYRYEEVWKIVRPYLSVAIGKRKRMGYASAQERLVVLLKEMVARLRNRIEEITLPEENSLLAAAKAALGTDASPNDLAPDELGCAETVSTLIGQVLPGFPVITGTWTLWQRLLSDDRFVLVMTPEPGDIVISPTGTGNGRMSGHVGIVGEYGRIMSNDSRDGTFDQNYDLETWRQRYGINGGFPIHYYRLIT
jgi:hypothetical protein